MGIALTPPRAERDFLGYGRDKPAANWPGGARVAVSFVVNFEEGAEYAISEGDDRNEAIYEVQHRLAGLPDLCLDSHFEYGPRAGWWRVMDVLDAHGVKATVSACGRAVERLPALARDAITRGHEVAAHGWRWESHAGMSEEVERQRIARTVSAIAEATGARPVGWHTRSASSPNTRRLLIEEGGFLYDSDAYNDDLPYALDFDGRRHVVMPYAFDTNDMQFQNSNRFRGAADFADYVLEAFDWLHREGASAPKMMSIGLHLRMIGRPGRIGALERIITAMRAKGGVWIARRDEIARHWLALPSAAK
jgi:peptidoglycan/xylan/chitin deacetylase (PgdA/CDA1 family)